jgi:capsular polysaccharide biosynthesis protein
VSKRTLGPASVQAEPPLAPDSIPVTRYAGAVRRHLAALVIALLAGGALGAAKVALTPATYTAQIYVLAPPVALHPSIDIGSALDTDDRAPRETTMDTEAQLVWSDTVLSKLAERPGFDASNDELRTRVDLTVPSNTHVLTLGVRARTPRAAQDGARVVADAYLALRTRVMGQVLARNREALEQNVELLKKQLAALPGDEDELRRLTARTRRQALVQQIEDVQKQVAAIKSKEEQPGEVLRTAPLPERRDDAARDVAGASGIGVGLLCWIGYVLLREARPRRIRRPADLRLHSRHPIMVEAATLGGGHREVARRLRNLVFDAEATTVLVAGVPGTAGTEVAYELAELCTEGGSATTVLRIAADGEALADPRTSRAPHSFAVRLVRSDDDRQLTRAVDKAGRVSRIVVITTPDINGADTIAAAAASDLTLVVAERGRALDRDVASGVLALDQAANPARVIVLTAPALRGPAPRQPRRIPDRTPSRATAPGRG